MCGINVQYEFPVKVHYALEFMCMHYIQLAFCVCKMAFTGNFLHGCAGFVICSRMFSVEIFWQMLATIESHFEPLLNGCLDNRRNWNNLAEQAAAGSSIEETKGLRYFIFALSLQWCWCWCTNMLSFKLKIPKFIRFALFIGNALGLMVYPRPTLFTLHFLRMLSQWFKWVLFFKQ